MGACLGAAGVVGGCREGAQAEEGSREGEDHGVASSSCLVAFPGEEAAYGRDAAGRVHRGHRGLLASLMVVADLGLAALAVVGGSVVAASASSSAFRGAFAAVAAACAWDADVAAGAGAAAAWAVEARARVEGLFVAAAAAAAAAEVGQTSRSAPLWCPANHWELRELGQELPGLLMVAMVVVRAWSLVGPRRLAKARLSLVQVP